MESASRPRRKNSEGVAMIGPGLAAVKEVINAFNMGVVAIGEGMLIVSESVAGPSQTADVGGIDPSNTSNSLPRTSATNSNQLETYIEAAEEVEQELGGIDVSGSESSCGEKRSDEVSGKADLESGLAKLAARASQLLSAFKSTRSTIKQAEILGKHASQEEDIQPGTGVSPKPDNSQGSICTL